MMQLNVDDVEELVFPIDTAGYLRRSLVKSGRVAIYAVSTKDRMPTKIGISADLNTRMSAMQTGYWENLYFYYVLWTPGKLLAELIEKSIHVRLYKECIRQEWFKINPTQARTIITEEAYRLADRARLIEHTAMVELLKRGKKTS